MQRVRRQQPPYARRGISPARRSGCHLAAAQPPQFFKSVAQPFAPAEDAAKFFRVGCRQRVLHNRLPAVLRACLCAQVVIYIARYVPPHAVLAKVCAYGARRGIFAAQRHVVVASAHALYGYRLDVGAVFFYCLGVFKRQYVVGLVRSSSRRFFQRVGVALCIAFALFKSAVHQFFERPAFGCASGKRKKILRRFATESQCAHFGYG